MSENNTKCVFCEKNTDKKTIKFTSETLKKCKTVMEYCRSKPNVRKSRKKYNNIELSDESLNEGYHAKCYKLFTAIQIPADFQKNEENKVEDTNKNIESHAAAPSSTTEAVASTDEVDESSDFEDLCDEVCSEPFYYVTEEDFSQLKCFLCKKSKRLNYGRRVPLILGVDKQTETVLKTAATTLKDKRLLKKINSFSKDFNIAYHKCCKDYYLRGISKRDANKFIKREKELNDSTCQSLAKAMDKYLVQDTKRLFIEHIREEFKKLEEEDAKSPDTVNSTPLYMRLQDRKIIKTFYDKLAASRQEKQEVPCLSADKDEV
ncbi:uncharacterized protein LOC126377895 [Pectinophora gossypiella]|uniref:uncharacterized protein LOC126377895 n=1 Tax=Pectinophora gossypiella TaxID=13191 RepID=UPI00214E9E99|nr:uncharacterized protein LOC126377895 [Pectinophora gossypiella]